MKKLLVLAFLAVMAFVWVNRQRVYVRDPVAKVFRDGERTSGVQVFLNYSNDILLIREETPGAYRVVVQHWNQIPGAPVHLVCLHWMACLADTEHVAAIPIGTHDPKVAMTDRVVSFVDGSDGVVRVELR